MSSSVYSLWLPDELVHRYEQAARAQGMARNRLMKNVLEAALPAGNALGDDVADPGVVE